MFTGIIETIGLITDIRIENNNKHFDIKSNISQELKIDQSVAHEGVCLTVVAIHENAHTVTAINETLQKSNLNLFKIGSKVNLERCMQINGRLDGHIVQGHVDCTAFCTDVIDKNGSWEMNFEYEYKEERVTVEKGSICINGVSLTVFNSTKNTFSVAIIPYTYYNTSMSQIKSGDLVNLEFDIIGKYVAKLLSIDI